MIDADFNDEPDCLVSMDLEERIQHLMDGGCESCGSVLCLCGHRAVSHDKKNRPSGFVCILGCGCRRYVPGETGRAA